MLVSDGAPESEETPAVWPEVRLGAFVMVFETATELGVVDTDAEFDPDPGTEADGDEDAELAVEGEAVLDCPIDPRTLLRLLDATTVVGWAAELVALDMSIPEVDSG